MQLEELRQKTPVHELVVEESDWARLTRAEALRLTTLFLAARRFEEKILQLDKLNLVHGPAHSSIGQEGAAAGCIAALPVDTLMNGTHRAHHQCIAKAVNALYDDGLDPSAAGLTLRMHQEIQGMMHEILGLKDGWTGGRGGSMHLRRAELGIMGTNAIVAGGIPIACGHAYAEKQRGSGKTMVTFFGDGAVHQGATHEAMNLAALYGLPMIFFLENNKYAVSMSVEQSTFETELLTRPQGHGIAGVKVDGMNPFATWLATRWAQEHIVRTGRPAFILAEVYRYYHQSSSIPGSAFGYRTREEENAWKARDPWLFLQQELKARGILREDELSAVDAAVTDAVEAAAASCIEGTGSSARIRAGLWPAAASVDEHLNSDMSEFEGVLYAEAEDYADEEMEPLSYIEAIARAMGARMAEDETIHVFGEDVANMGGGTVGATRGLTETYAGRLVNTPITENGFCGLATGAALSGLKPVVELMYSDFFLVAGDQLLNQAGKIRHLFNGTAEVPLVLRARIPGPEGYGSQHSMDPAGVFALFPGWRIVAPSNAFDYVGLMNSALRCKDPVLVIEPQQLHKRKTPVPTNLDYYIPIGRAKRVREGDQITLLTTLTMVEECCRLVDEAGIRADVIDLRTLSQRDIDYDTIGRSVMKTGRVAIVEQTTRGASLGALIADEIQRRYFDYLDQPVKRVTGRWAPPVVSQALERAALAGEDDIRALIREMQADSALSAAQQEQVHAARA
ncbi:alpha-ketoacid dehydrogenase subunit alpha/beta [Achromobacter anxifer]|jgi:2-oxoisovalerate dehydrogenase E1 component|uniref:1-deoxy-D-xylulose-5-phosphate synthase n=1 Tax=Achromobacter anxifer TaxID=1287737 RepID=A0A6S7CR16_9BURK|nr:alpha-ketoacid dehydrogenase subunit alpha/beta [Achromobacter anxifer]MDF8365930.1 thiamine pyrophosphate-dependent enzyme [Achromobacter anxifer]CAB3860381.1 1-deoxy-D-xylulose-5-phosphate synthase [Achromobacter anxifer]CAB5510961.1 1-deoxy-D-xylulose-5-phosphate synthase [Achromobacter anxifer]